MMWDISYTFATTNKVEVKTGNMNTFTFLQYMVEQEHIALDALFEKLDDEKLQMPLTQSEGEEESIGSRLAHIIGAEYRMATYLYQLDTDDVENFTVQKDKIGDIKSKSKISMDRHMLTLRNLGVNDLDKIWTSKLSGNSYEYKYLLWHFIEHIATHRGQVSSAINRIE